MRFIPPAVIPANAGIQFLIFWIARAAPGDDDGSDGKADALRHSRHAPAKPGASRRWKNILGPAFAGVTVPTRSSG